MKKLLVFLCFISFISFNGQSLFDDSILHEIRVTSTEDNFWQILDNEYQEFLNNGTEIPYHSVSIEIDGNLLENVGIRQKGFSSNFFVNTTKKPLKLNFGKFVEDQRYDDVKKLNLANGLGDPAIVKDKVVYDMYRQHGIPAPRVAHTKVYINDVFWGTYGMIEQIDKRYLKRNFADKTGNLWKNKGNSNLNWLGTNPNSYSFELQTNEEENDWTKFINFIDFINNSTDGEFEDGIESIFDLDEYLRILAIDILTNNWDSYIEHGRNWYLYHEPKTDKIHWLPWDYNFAFDRSTGGFGDFSLLLVENNKVLVDRILEIPEFRERYLSYMCEIIEVNFTDERLDPKLDAQLDLIDDDWNTANNNFYFLNDVQDAVNGNTWHGFPINSESVQGFKKFIEDRTPVIETGLSNLSFTCIPLVASINFQDVVINEFMANNLDESPWSDQDNENDDWIELYNNTNSEIDLTNYFLSDSPSFIHKWEFAEGTTIPANGYLIIWADKDPQQEGLHTKFNLDKNGDEIFLSYLDGTIIDSVDYSEEQEENQSLSRIPNGTGDFVPVAVTFNSENLEELGVSEISSQYGINVYPNPVATLLNVDFTNTQPTKVLMYDIVGREVYNQEITNSNLKINTSNWSNGIYIIKFVSETYSVSQKIIVE